MRKLALVVSLAAGLALAAAAARPGRCAPDSAESAAAEMAEAAVAFWNALTPEQQAKCGFDLKDKERKNWHYMLPERRGVPLKEMAPAQRLLAHAFLSSVLSRRGALEALTVMSLEQIILDLDMNPKWDPERYYFWIFGKPAPGATWGWRIEGRHLSINGTIVRGKYFAATPTFFGALPMITPEGPRKGLRVLVRQDELGRELVKSLSEEQREIAILKVPVPGDVVSGPGRKLSPLEPAGLPAAKMTPAQGDLLMKVVREFVERHRPEVSEQLLERIDRSGREKVHFAWVGGLEPGQGHYYRVQGPTFLIEHDNVQTNANHVHSVWRDFENDFGEDLLKRHYQEEHPK